MNFDKLAFFYKDVYYEKYEKHFLIKFFFLQSPNGILSSLEYSTVLIFLMIAGVVMILQTCKKAIKRGISHGKCQPIRHVSPILVDRPTQLIYIGISIC